MARKKRVYKVAPNVVGSTRLFQVVEDASPELKALAREFPQYLSSALNKLAYRVGKEIKLAIKRGGTPSHPWKPLSLMHQHNKIARYLVDKNNRHPRRPRGSGPRVEKEGMYKRWAGKGDTASAKVFLGEAARAMGLYEQSSASNLKVEIGAINRTLETALDNFQAGLITPMNMRLRRTLWGAAIPTNLTALVQPPRPLIEPVFQRLQPYFEPMLMYFLQGYIEGKSGKEIGDYEELPWR